MVCRWFVGIGLGKEEGAMITGITSDKKLVTLTKQHRVVVVAGKNADDVDDNDDVPIHL